MLFRNLSLAKKLTIGFGVVLAIVASSSAVTVVQVRQAAEIERLNASSSDAIGDLDQVWGRLNAAQFNLSRFVLTGDEDDRSKVQSSITDLNTDLASAKDILSSDGPDMLPDLVAFQDKLDTLTQRFIAPVIELASHAESRQRAMTAMLSAPSGAAAEDVGNAFRSLRDKVSFWSDTSTAAGSLAMTQIKLVVLISAVVTVLLGSAMAWIIVQAIRRPIVAMTAAMKRLAAGDNTITVPALDQRDEVGQMAATVQTFKEAALEKLRLEGEAGQARRTAETERSGHEADRARAATLQAHVVNALAEGLAKLSQGDLVFRLNDRFAPEYEALKADFNAAMDQLQDTIRTVSANANTIRSGTSEISTASNDLSRRTEQQAASLEQTAAALNEITVTVRKTAEGASHARTVVAAAKADAEHSGEVVRKAVQAMGAIEGSSRQISQIIGVIDEIAFQTNLLALNAGVEAARAGDAGRGFAVVASEVRSLAQRSAEAAKEIKALILASGHQVSQGVGLVGETGEALTRIAAQVSEITAVVNGMAVAAQEQSTALGEINVAINQMDQMTQQNAAMVEESTAASHSLSQETGRLTQLIGRFQTGEGAGKARVPDRARASGRTSTALKTVGRGGAVLQSEPQAGADGWDEF